MVNVMEINQINWSELQDAYGEASKIPGLLQQVIANKALVQNNQSGPWFDLWSRLCHQDSIYTASYAAVPILVEAIHGAEEPLAMDFFLLPVSIELARTTGEAPPIPEELKDEYETSIQSLGDLSEKLLAKDMQDINLKRAAQSAKLVSEGKYSEASELID